MKKFNLGFLALALTLMVTSSHAATISLGGIPDPQPIPVGSTGTLQILINTSPENFSFRNGGVQLELTSSNPTAVTFSNPTIVQPARWSGTVGTGMVGTAAQFVAFSLNTDGLNGAGSQLFATVDYTAISSGLATFSLASFGEDALFDGAQGDVSGAITLNGGSILVGVPEPATMAMAGMSLIGLAFRRRNG